MMTFNPDIYSYELPLKQPLPCFHYDLAVYCRYLKRIIGMPLPEYLCDLSDRINAYAKQVRKCKPPKFPNMCRIYLVDYRLRFLFAGLDETGEIATFFSQYGRRGLESDDAYYGDSTLRYITFPEGYNTQELKVFEKEYGFLPIEELAAPISLIFLQNKLDDVRILSQYQLCLLMEKFRSENLIGIGELTIQRYAISIKPVPAFQTDRRWLQIGRAHV